jgi:hypothetical protein
VRIYVAASSEELNRAKGVMERLERLGHTVTKDWVIEVEQVGTANPRDATADQRAAWAQEDLDGVAQADLVWLLMPTGHSVGAFWEAGYAQAMHKRLIVSGDHQRSIFPATAHRCFDTDEEALKYIGNYWRNCVA